MQQRTKFGIDHFLQQSQAYKGKRLALVTNNAAVTSEGVSSREALMKNGFLLVKLFSPEHGLTAAGADGLLQHNTIDPLTGVPVISLYGDYLAPGEDDLKDIDAVLFDIPDVGCRFYTYLWTMTMVMESCAVYKKPLIILDRPNPNGGNIFLAEGPMLDEVNCASFIGRWSIPIRHCCTLGELARYFAATRIKTLLLEVLPCTNWTRGRDASTQPPEFISPSPAIKNLTTILLYPGMGLLEGINVNEGRGTNKPFHICGAPWMDSAVLFNVFTAKKTIGISCEPYAFKPSEGLYAGQHCNGLEFFITDVESFRPVATGIALLKTIIDLYPDHVKERLYPTRANPSGEGHLDKLLGIQHAFMKIKNGEVISSDIGDGWRVAIQPSLLYY